MSSRVRLCLNFGSLGPVAALEVSLLSRAFSGIYVPICAAPRMLSANTQQDESICNARGNVFTIAQSKSWKPLGAWQLGLDYLAYGGNGDYGLDKLSSTLLTGSTMRMDNIITASINSTNFYLGYLGLGITKGSFGNSVADSPLTQAVKNYGWIPSYSYGYTAGAYYSKCEGRSRPVSDLTTYSGCFWYALFSDTRRLRCEPICAA